MQPALTRQKTSRNVGCGSFRNLGIAIRYFGVELPT